jgi:hypothetical protein
MVMARAPIYVRQLTDDERAGLTAGLRSQDAFVLRRCQILLASANGKRAAQIGAELGCDTDTALNAIKAFNQTGLAALQAGSSGRPPLSRLTLPAGQLGALLRSRATSAKGPACGHSWLPSQLRQGIRRNR